MKDVEEETLGSSVEEPAVEKKQKREKKEASTAPASSSKSNGNSAVVDEMRRELLKSCSRAELVCSCVDKGVVTATFATNNGHVTVSKDA